jgi:hypothetical protein
MLLLLCFLVSFFVANAIPTHTYSLTFSTLTPHTFTHSPTLHTLLYTLYAHHSHTPHTSPHITHTRHTHTHPLSHLTPSSTPSSTLSTHTTHTHLTSHHTTLPNLHTHPPSTLHTLHTPTPHTTPHRSAVVRRFVRTDAPIAVLVSCITLLFNHITDVENVWMIVEFLEGKFGLRAKKVGYKNKKTA